MTGFTKTERFIETKYNPKEYNTLKNKPIKDSLIMRVTNKNLYKTSALT